MSTVLMASEVKALHRDLCREYSYDKYVRFRNGLHGMDPTQRRELFDLCSADREDDYTADLLGICYDLEYQYPYVANAWFRPVTGWSQRMNDLSRALQEFRRAADAGNAMAMVFVGMYYREAKGTLQDDQKADEWWTKSGTALRDFVRYLCVDRPKQNEVGCNEATILQMALHAGVFPRWLRLEEENSRLRDQVSELQTELDYRPGGDGYREARDDFIKRASDTGEGHDSGLQQTGMSL